MDLEEFKKRAENAKWTFAKTYAKTAPHSYVVLDKDSETLKEIRQLIEEH